ncbi:hypothetical protein D5S17_14915 [Pseudonocardiaceae bacterium YIM PH 21723]|nr:hypothetical protein D5S17_14915 [Pseudonocardiaceae bacterium YIM PH 21723]
MKTPGIYIAGTGAYVPDTMSAEEALGQGLYTRDDYDWYGWTGAAVAGTTPAPDMAITAARQAVERSGRHPSEIDVHVHAHSWPQGPIGWSPHHYILRHITNRDVPSFLTWQACAGMAGALELAVNHLMAVPERTGALVTGADNVGTPDFNRWGFGLQNGVIGDGASSLLLSTKDGFASLLSINSGSTAELEMTYRGADPIFPPPGIGTKVDFQERLSGYGDDLGDTVAEIVSRQGELRTELALATMAEAGIGPEDVTRVCHVFTGLESYLKVIIDPMGLSVDKGLLDYGRRLGHCTVNDQFIALNHLVETGQVGPGDHILIVAHGGGTAITTAALRIDRRPAWATGGPSVTRSPSTSSARTARVQLTPEAV